MTEEATKAQRTTVRIGSLEVDGFMLPDGSYRMSQTQAAQQVNKPEINARRFLTSKAIEAMLGEGYTPDTIEVESEAQTRGQTRFNALTLEVVTAYWINQCFQGNKSALVLVLALATESLERRFDNAFGVQRSEDEYNNRLSERIQQLETDLGRLSDAYGVEDEIRRERDRFERLLRENGIDPYDLPGQD